MNKRFIYVMSADLSLFPPFDNESWANYGREEEEEVLSLRGRGVMFVFVFDPEPGGTRPPAPPQSSAEPQLTAVPECGL